MQNRCGPLLPVAVANIHTDTDRIVLTQGKTSKVDLENFIEINNWIVAYQSKRLYTNRSISNKDAMRLLAGMKRRNVRE